MRSLCFCIHLPGRNGSGKKQKALDSLHVSGLKRIMYLVITVSSEIVHRCIITHQYATLSVFAPPLDRHCTKLFEIDAVFFVIGG